MTRRSVINGGGFTIEFSVAILFPGVGSASLPRTVAEFEITPAVVAAVMIVTAEFSALANVPRAHVTVPLV